MSHLHHKQQAVSCRIIVARPPPPPLTKGGKGTEEMAERQTQVLSDNCCKFGAFRANFRCLWALWCPCVGCTVPPAQNGLPVPTVGWREIDTMTVVDGHPVPILGTGSAVPTKHAKNGHGSAHAMACMGSSWDAAHFGHGVPIILPMGWREIDTISYPMGTVVPIYGNQSSWWP